MTNQGKDPKCRFWCWAIAALAGVFIFFMLLSVATKSFGASLFLGLVGFVLLGLLFNWLFCAPVPVVDQNRRVASADAAGNASASSAAPTSASAAPASEVAAVEAADTPAAAGDASDATRAAEASGASVTASTTPAIKPSAPLAGEAELAERKGEFKYEAPADETATADADAEAQKKAKRQAKRKAKRQAEKAEAEAATAAQEAAAREKAERQAKRKAKQKAQKAAQAEAAAAEAAATPDFDNDGVLEGTDEGTKPALLSAARDGGADDLKRIKGIGPKLEGVCNDMGVYHFDQIAAWTDQEMAWVNANLLGFKGRATRDKWVEQAKLLAAGEETEFSKRVDKGSVY